MAHNGTTFTLNTGAKIPAIGFGTWQDKEAQEPYAFPRIIEKAYQKY
jgi:diketogulonate reductase-like aldo/keto reductase